MDPRGGFIEVIGHSPTPVRLGQSSDRKQGLYSGRKIGAVYGTTDWRALKMVPKRRTQI